MATQNEEDPESRSPNPGLQYSYGVDYRTKMGIYFLDPPWGLGIACRRPDLEQSAAFKNCAFELQSILGDSLDHQKDGHGIPRSAL